MDLFEPEECEAKLNPPQDLCSWCGQPVFEGNTLQRNGAFLHERCKRVNRYHEWQTHNYTAPLEISLDLSDGTLSLYDVQYRKRIYVHRDALAPLRDALYEVCAQQNAYDAKCADEETD